MRKIIMHNHVTLEGYFAGPKGEIDWILWNEELAEFSREQACSGSTDTLLFGRVTYDLMADYWPTPKGIADDPEIAGFMNKTEKIVFSKTLKKADWNNTMVVGDMGKDEILNMKRKPGGDIVIFGSGSIVRALTNMGLIDDYRVLIHPVILGAGKPLFGDLKGRTNLRLLNTRTFGGGAVALHYQKGG